MRNEIRRWLDLAIDEVDPNRLMVEALNPSEVPQRTVIAIGKAAPAMCRGAAQALGDVRGVCVAATSSEVPDGVELLVGDHPVPGEASLRAGQKVLDVVRKADEGWLALISGGGSSLCEWPRPGVDLTFLRDANRRLLLAGSSIEETNLVRGHLSEIKCGGLARASRAAFATYVLSDVAGAGPEVVASGPTLEMEHDPERAQSILEAIGIEIPHSVKKAMSRRPRSPRSSLGIVVIGDGQSAAQAICDAARADGLAAGVDSSWFGGEPEQALDNFLERAGTGITVAAGETAPRVVRSGRGGRNTHAALMAAKRIAGSDQVFCAFATDGVDGSSGAAGAIVDGETIDKGGDPGASIERFDSATYLDRTGDLVLRGPTGTNVADLWLLWRP